MTQSILCLGEVMVELSMDPSDPAKAAIGVAGDTFNTAIYLKRQVPDLSVSYGTKLGRDRFSEMILDKMAEESLLTDALAFSDDRLPGLYAISTDKHGERSFSY